MKSGKTVKISDAEYPLMEYIWAHGRLQATDLTAFAGAEFDWKKNTTYTVLKRLIDRGAIRREDPGFYVVPLVSREEVQRAEVDSLMDRIFGGSVQAFMTAFLQSERLSQQEREELRQAVAQLKQDTADERTGC